MVAGYYSIQPPYPIVASSSENTTCATSTLSTLTGGFNAFFTQTTTFVIGGTTKVTQTYIGGHTVVTLVESTTTVCRTP